MNKYVIMIINEEGEEDHIGPFDTQAEAIKYIADVKVPYYQVIELIKPEDF